MAAFEYRYNFSVDEEIIRRYGSGTSDWHGNSIIETRIKFIVVGGNSNSNSNSGKKIKMIVDSESFALGGWPKKGLEGYLEYKIGTRLKDYWMPDREIRTMINQLVLFADQIDVATGKIPLAIDLEICTVQREGEDMAAATERAMKPEYLPPLYLYAWDGIPTPSPMLPGLDCMNSLEVMQSAAIRVEDVDKAVSVMDLCGICERKPMFGTQISSLPCAHAFHYHCIARSLLEVGNYCPVCHLQPACEFYRFIDNCQDDDDEDILEAFVTQLQAVEEVYGFRARARAPAPARARARARARHD